MAFCEGCKNEIHVMHEPRTRAMYKDESLDENGKIKNTTILPGNTCTCKGECVGYHEKREQFRKQYGPVNVAV